ncbi:MAG: VCBS repeat-containing protein, partial [Bdellovibrionales bacterium]|nr:VCBS repeat-containing protein [Bdellovibrionales bacterium]
MRAAERGFRRSHLLVVAAAIALGISGLGARADAPPQMSVPGSFSVGTSGAATYSIPIEAPPGTANVAPSLSLVYSSQSGDGPEGFGWVLNGLPSVSRCPRTTAQDSVHGSVNFDSNDRFCLDGQHLMLISGTYGADGSEYRTEVENFERVIAHGTAGNGPAWFEVHTKSGLTFEFGNTTDSRSLAVGKTTARLWAVNKMMDTKGNYFTVTYTNDTTNGQIYPTEIDYTGNASASVSPYNSVKFTYTTRSDITPTYQAGSLHQTTVLLSHIKTYHGATLIWDYQLTYRAGTTTTHSRLTEVQLCDGSGTCLAPTQFTWQGGTGTLSSSSSTPGISSNFLPLLSGDFNGDGLTDVIVDSSYDGTNFSYCPSGGTLYLGNSSSTFASGSYTMTTKLAVTGSTYSGDACLDATAVVDIDGDGRLDIALPLWKSGGYIATNPHSMLLNGGSGSFNSIGKLGGLTGVLGAIGDLNGDSRIDGLVGSTGPVYKASIGDGTGTFTDGATYPDIVDSSAIYVADLDGDGCDDIVQNDGSAIIDYSCSPATSQVTTTLSGSVLTFGDFNGDGKQDILSVVSSTGGGTLYLSTGTGLVATSFSVPTSWDGNAYYVVGDWNGDGKADLAVLPATSLTATIYLSTGSGFVSATTASYSTYSSRGFGADWNNDGADDLWISSSGTGDHVFTFGYTPELITAISNGLGQSTTVTYDRLNHGTIYTKGTGASYPTQDIIDARYVVSRVDIGNAVGGTVARTYAYSGFKNDVSGRGELGFSQIVETNLQDGTVYTTNYRTDFPYIGQLSSSTVVHGSTTLSSKTYTLENVALGSGRYFVGVHQTVASGHDLNGATLPTTTTTYTYDCDSSTTCYGNTTQIAASVSDGSSKTITNTYTVDTTHWYIAELTGTNVESVVGTSDITRHSTFGHDSTSGILNQEIVEPSSCQYKLQTDYTLDSFGHKSQTAVSGAGCTTGDIYSIASRTSTASYATTDGATTLQPTAGEFLTKSCNALSQCETWNYTSASSQAFGVPGSHAGPNGLATSWSYDSFGRATLETRPDGTKTSTTYAYCSGVNGGSATCPTYGAFLRQVEAFASDGTTQIGPIATVYYDALGRVIAQDMQGYNGSTIRTATVYDAQGRVYQTSRPYFVSGGTAKWTTYTYDDLARVIQATFPDSSHTNFCYNGLETAVTNNLSQTTSTIANAQGLKATVKQGTGVASSTCEPTAITTTTTYSYDAFDDLLKVTDTSSNAITNVYDARGNKTDSTDPDMGHWTYVYDVLGELKSQTDAKSQTATLTYDLLGRVTERSEAGLVSDWVYGTSSGSHNVGQLVTTCTSSSSNPTCASATTTKAFTYDSTGRPSTSTITVDSASYVYTTAYNTTNGQVDTVADPSGLTTKRLYNAYGYTCRITDNGGSHTCTTTADGHVLWTAGTRDAELHLLTQTAGNGAFTTTETFDANTGLLTNIRAGTADAVAAFDYTFDTIGNLTYRSDDHVGVYEKFCYDPSLNRLTNSATASTTPSLCTSTGGGITSKTVGYDNIGNITSKSDVGTYSYPASGASSVRPHAVSSITGTVSGVTNPTYGYDSNGNLTCVYAASGGSCGSPATAVTWSSFNMVASITQGTTVIAFTYDSDHQRIKQCTGTSCSGGTTYYLNDPISGTMSEKTVSGSTVTWHDYLVADGRMVG